MKRRSGIESAIGGLQSGNGLVRRRDVGEVGFECYVAMAILSRNIQSLGKFILSCLSCNLLSGQTPATTKRRARKLSIRGMASSKTSTCSSNGDKTRKNLQSAEITGTI